MSSGVSENVQLAAVRQESSVSKPQQWSWWPTVTVMLASLLSYIDRNTLAALAPTIMKDLKLTAEDYGLIVSCFSIAYMVGNPLWGFILDRIGAKKGYGLAVSLWTIASGFHAAVGSFFSLATARGTLGLAEGATFPGALKTVSETLPSSRQARGIAIAISGGSLGAVLTPLIVTPIALRFGWRTAFLVTGAGGAAWVLSWFIFGQRRAHSESIRREKSLIRWNDLRIFAYASTYSLGAFPLAVGLYAAPLYLARVLSLSQKEIGLLLWIPPAGWELGYLFWGWLADRHMRNPHRYLNWMITLAILGLPFLALSISRSVSLTMGLFFWCMFVAGGFVVLSLRYGIQVFSSTNAAVMTGIGAGAWSAVVAILMPIIGRLFDHSLYSCAFVLTCGLPAAGVALFAVLTHGWRRSG